MVPPSDDLIVAPASPPGRGAISVVRASGREALRLATVLTGRSSFTPRRATRATLTLHDGLFEDALVSVFVSPHSFTGEDLVEFSVHGSPVIVEALLHACFTAGARLARPGEFTFRAYVNGRLDLLQAEAVGDLVASTTPAQVAVASAHLHGALSHEIATMGDEIAALRALLEASLDFPDEGFHFIAPETLALRVEAVRTRCRRLLASASPGRRLHDGATVVIVGRPNAGKSSLFNALLRRQRAIVTDVPGTTRDLLTEVASFGGVPVTLVDTAGLRITTDVVEREGVARAEATMDAADVVLLVVDPGASPDDLAESSRVWSTLSGRDAICVSTRLDVQGRGALRPEWMPADTVAVSCTTGENLSVLEQVLASLVGQGEWPGATLTRARHRSAIQQCESALGRAAETIADGGSEEFVLVDLRDALLALEGLRGVETTEQVLESIFSTFCIGK